VVAPGLHLHLPEEPEELLHQGYVRDSGASQVVAKHVASSSSANALSHQQKTLARSGEEVFQLVELAMGKEVEKRKNKPTSSRYHHLPFAECSARIALFPI